MENLHDFEEELFDNSDIEDEFQSCCTEDEEWQETKESLAEGTIDDLDEFSLRMFFKGVSSSHAHDKESRVSGIGVVMERLPGVPLIQVQKKLDFHVEELVAEHLALMDGLLAALQNGARRLYAFTDSEKLYYQIAETEILDDQLLVALGHRILELADKLEEFDLQLVSSFELERPLRLAKEAIGDWCGHEFCSSCSAEYRNAMPTCLCAFWGSNNMEERSSTSSNQESEPWTLEPFDYLSVVMDEYSDQERAQLALIQRFLSGGFSLSDHHHPPQSPPRCSDSYMDTVKDLHQLPWLERFVSVISDSYQEDFV